MPHKSSSGAGGPNSSGHTAPGQSSTSTAPPPSAGTAAATTAALWGVYLHPSVFRLHTTAKEVFSSLHKNDGLSPPERTGSGSIGSQTHASLSSSSSAVVSYLVGSDAPAEVSSATAKKHDNVKGDVDHTNAFLAYSGYGSHPQLISFEFHLCPAFSSVRADDAAAATQKALQRDPLYQQLKSSRMNSLEAILPGASEHPQLTAQQLLRNPFSSGGERASSFSFTPSSPGGAKESERDALLSPLYASSSTDAGVSPETETLRQQAEQVQACLYGSRRCTAYPLYLYAPAPQKGCLSGSVVGQKMGCGEGTGLDGSPLLSGLQIALASMQEGEEASFFIASPQGFEYTAPQLKSIAASMNYTTTGTPTTTGTTAGGPFAPTRSSSASPSSPPSSRSSSSSSSASSSSTNSTKAEKKEKQTSYHRSLRERLGFHRHSRGGKHRDASRKQGKDTNTAHTATNNPNSSSGGIDINTLPQSHNGVPAPAVAHQLVQHGATKVLFYAIRLLQRVPVMNIVYASTTLTQSFLSLPGTAGHGVGGATLIVPRPLASTRGALKRWLSSCGAAAATPGDGAAAATRSFSSSSSFPSSSSALTALSPGCVNPFLFFTRSNISGDLLTLVEHVRSRRSGNVATASPSPPSSSSSSSSSLSAPARRRQRPVAPFIATFIPPERCNTSTTTTTTTTAAAPPPPPPQGEPCASAGSTGIDVDSVVQQVLGDDETVRQAQLAAYTATLFTMASRGNSQERISPNGSQRHSTGGGVRVNELRFDAFSFFDAFDECVEVIKGGDGGGGGVVVDGTRHGASTVRVVLDPSKVPGAALAFLEQDFLTFHKLSSNVVLRVEAYNPLLQSFFSVNPFGGGGAGDGSWSVTVGSVAVPCWVDLLCRGLPRHHSVSSVVHLLGDASDELFVSRLLTDIRCEANRCLDEMESVRHGALQQLEREFPEGEEGEGEEGEEGPFKGDDGSTPWKAKNTAEEGLTPKWDALHPAPTRTVPAASQGTSPQAGQSATSGGGGGGGGGGSGHAMPTSSSHFTSSDAAGYRRATAPLARQRRLENTYRVLLQSPSARSTSSTTVGKDSFFSVNPIGSCAAVRALLAEACGLLSYYDASRSRPVDGCISDAARALVSLVQGHQTSLALLLDGADLSEYALPTDVSSLLRGDVLEAVMAAAVSATAGPSAPSSAAPADRDTPSRGAGGDTRTLFGASRSKETGGAGGRAAAVAVTVAEVAAATHPALIVERYYARQHPKFSSRAEKGSQPSTLNTLLLGSTRAAATVGGGGHGGPSSGGASGVLPMDVVAAAAMFLPSPPMNHALREHYTRQRILFKVLERLYTCIFLLTFNVDEASACPDGLVDLNTRDNTSAAAASTTPGAVDELGKSSSSVAAPGSSPGDDAKLQQQGLRLRRYGYLAEAYQYTALVYAEMDGMTSHALDAVAAALLYAPRHEELWMLRAVLLTRQRQYLRASLDLDVAAALTERRLQLTLVDDEGKRSEESRNAVAFLLERQALLRLQQQGVYGLLVDAHGNATGGGSRRGSVAGALSPTCSSAVTATTAHSTAKGPLVRGTHATLHGNGDILASSGNTTAPTNAGSSMTATALGGAGTSVTTLPVMGSGLLSVNGAGSVLH